MRPNALETLLDQSSEHISISLKKNSVTIYVTELTENDTSCIKKIFDHFFDENFSSFTIVTSDNIFSRSKAFKKESYQDCIHDLIEEMSMSQGLCSILFVALIQSAVDCHCNTDHEKIIKNFHEKIKEALTLAKEYKRENIHFTKYVNKLFDCLDVLYSLFNQKNYFDVILSESFLLSLRARNIGLVKRLSNHESYREIMIKNDVTHHFLHQAIKINNESFEILLNLFQQNNILPQDDKGNTFLHVCKNTKYLEHALSLTENSDAYNKEGYTALHLAAYKGDLNKARFLLLNKADPELKTKHSEDNFWTLKIKNKISSSIAPRLYRSLINYRYYKLNGLVLNLLPEVFIQKNLTCGFYAAFFATSSVHDKNPSIRKSLLPAKKSDQINSKNSLRSIRQQLGIKYSNAIFTTKELATLIKQNKCNSYVYHFENYEEFLCIVRTALQHNLPIVMPYSVQQNDVNRNPNPQGDVFALHWATIMGFVDLSGYQACLLSHFGEYIDTPAKELFNSSFNLGDHFPGGTFYKTEKKWCVSEKPLEDPKLFKKTEVVPVTSLKDFKQKLIVVAPFDFDEKLLITELQNNKLKI